MAMDKDTASFSPLQWVRVLVKSEGRDLPSSLLGLSCLTIQLWWEVPPWVLVVASMSSRSRGVRKLRGDDVTGVGKSMSWRQPIVQSAEEIVLSEGGERCRKAMVISSISTKGTVESPWRRNGTRSLAGGQSGTSVKAPPMAL